METIRVRGTKIVSPGKFEGKPVFVPYYWGLANEGFVDSEEEQDGTLYSIFDIKDEDLISWPMLKGLVQLTLWEDSQGFVHCSTAGA